jgi:hypothetical protein
LHLCGRALGDELSFDTRWRFDLGGLVVLRRNHRGRFGLKWDLHLCRRALGGKLPFHTGWGRRRYEGGWLRFEWDLRFCCGALDERFLLRGNNGGWFRFEWDLRF